MHATFQRLSNLLTIWLLTFSVEFNRALRVRVCPLRHVDSRDDATSETEQPADNVVAQFNELRPHISRGEVENGAVTSITSSPFQPTEQTI